MQLPKSDSHNFLKATGILQGYEAVIGHMMEGGFPDNGKVFDHAAYLLLKWEHDNQK